MDEIKVIWTNIARQQRDKVFEFWNDRNKSTNYSKKLNADIYSKIDILKANPFAGKISSLDPLRILHFGNYSLIYRISKPYIYIMAFWDNRQNPNKLKKLLGL